ncbi:unnamed protein product [Dicrocoelium dendriticum]|nr:unnamed protein product [Dicrocoelium dendriticum]
MLYFEDFMEAVENLPDELKESLATVRQLDLSVLTIMEPLKETTKTFFEDNKCGRLSESQKAAQRAEIMAEYDKALSYCKEKRGIVEKIFCTYKKLVRKLDAELEKFRLELEADNSGVTEQIEKRVLGKSPCAIIKPEIRRRIVGQACRTVLKSPVGRSVHSANQAQRMAGRTHGRVGGTSISQLRASDAWRLPTGNALRNSAEAQTGSVGSTDELCFPRRIKTDYFPDPDPYGTDSNYDTKPISLNLFPPSSTIKSTQDGSEYNESGFSHDITMLATKSSPFYGLGANSEAGSSTSDKPTTPMSGSRGSRQGHSNVLPHTSDLSDSGIPSGRSASTSTVDSRLSGIPSPVSWPPTSSSRDRRSRGSRRMGRDALFDELVAPDSLQSSAETAGFEDGTASGGMMTPTDSVFEPGSFGFVPDMKLEPVSSTLGDEGEEEDEDQKRYCICNDVSYGDMIACDNPNCSIEWFHYGCVNLTVAPKGNWFCPSCIKSYSGIKGMKKRMTRK